MKILINEKISPHRYKDNHGYLICTDCIMARTGKQTYTRDECFGDGDSTEIEVDRPSKEVFDAKTMASFENVPITIEHPSVNVDPDNYNTLSVGHMRDIRKGTYEGQPVMVGTAVITDSEAIEKVESGNLTNLSCGYDCDIDDSDNPHQFNIRGNHIALCECPRAGITHIQDSKKAVKKKYEVTIDSEDSMKDSKRIRDGEELARKGFMTLVKLYPYGYSILNDGNFVKRVNASDDDEAIEKFNEFLAERARTRDSKKTDIYNSLKETIEKNLIANDDIGKISSRKGLSDYLFDEYESMFEEDIIREDEDFLKEAALANKSLLKKSFAYFGYNPNKADELMKKEDWQTAVTFIYDYILESEVIPDVVNEIMAKKRSNAKDSRRNTRDGNHIQGVDEDLFYEITDKYHAVKTEERLQAIVRRYHVNAKTARQLASYYGLDFSVFRDSRRIRK